MLQVSISELKTDFDKYMEMVGNEKIYITRDGRQVAKLIAVEPDPPIEKELSIAERHAMLDSLIGILPPDIDLAKARDERLQAKEARCQ